jgi:hypothetical protein
MVLGNWAVARGRRGRKGEWERGREGEWESGREGEWESGREGEWETTATNVEL